MKKTMKVNSDKWKNEEKEKQRENNKQKRYNKRKNVRNPKRKKTPPTPKWNKNHKITKRKRNRLCSCISYLTSQDSSEPESLFYCLHLTGHFNSNFVPAGAVLSGSLLSFAVDIQFSTSRTRTRADPSATAIQETLCYYKPYRDSLLWQGWIHWTCGWMGCLHGRITTHTHTHTRFLYLTSAWAPLRGVMVNMLVWLPVTTK